MPAGGQQTNATIVGIVTDTTDALVVGAEVKVINTSTNTTRTAATDSSGQYSVPALPPGTYSLAVQMKGFQSQRVASIILNASQNARQDFKLSAGTITEAISVEASLATAQLQTENGAVGQVIDGKKIVDLPLNGRNFIQLGQLIPGVNSGTEGSITVRRARGALASSDATGGSTAIQVNGQRDTQNRYSIDGIENMDYDAFTYSFSTSVDAIAEFRVDTANSGTDSGAASGANVNQIIKSETNGLHGTLFYFNRNSAFTQSYDALTNKDVAPPRLNRNQYGGNVGGPVVIPKLVEKGTPYWSRPDLGLDLQDVKVEGKKILVTVHGLGAIDAPGSRIVLRDSSGNIVAQSNVPPLKAPTDLTPKTASVAVALPIGQSSFKGDTVEILSRGKVPEITTLNNKVVLDDAIAEYK